MLEVGDTVRLKSGGPVMTVIRIRNPEEADAYCVCAWFIDDKPVEYSFVFGALAKTQS